ncbi:ubiquitin-like-conjugating enzyme ATG10 [Anopheles nili]|uniref:ubiquitin-like-conjugating enzyme ATG10 n=1 Tax=Anopheles nili TaxID=185578 RepID=UPI00237A3639|nr:ubiquitin-like-conjugating enzyme ATG10 [Anopheles nili]
MHLREFIECCNDLVRCSEDSPQAWRWVVEGDHSYICMKKRELTCVLQTKQCDAVQDEHFAELNLEADPACASKSGILSRMVLYEYHVVYNESYAVPMLLFNIYDEGGSRLDLEEAWDVLKIGDSVDTSAKYHAVTMVHHPIVFRPYLSLHPCKTPELLDSLSHSANAVLSFLTTYGPYVNLRQDDLAASLLRTIGVQ